MYFCFYGQSPNCIITYTPPPIVNQFLGDFLLFLCNFSMKTTKNGNANDFLHCRFEFCCIFYYFAAFLAAFAAFFAAFALALRSAFVGVT